MEGRIERNGVRAQALSFGLLLWVKESRGRADGWYG